MTERPHPLTPLLKGWVIFGLIVFTALTQLAQIDLTHIPRDRWPMVIGISVGVIVLIFLVATLFSYLSWRYTRFVIDDEQIRIEHTFITHRLDRIAFSKVQSVDVVQPLIPRLFGLASLTIDVGGGESAKKIEYIKRDRAYQLRDYLMTRAHGVQTTVEESAALPIGGVFDETAATDRVIVRVPVMRYLASLALSTTIWFFIILAIVAVLFLVIIGAEGFLFIFVLLPILMMPFIGVLTTLRTDYNFTLTMTPSGALRTSAGLTTLASQSIPLHRVQGIVIRQPLLWRIIGWYRVQVEVLGMVSASSDNSSGLAETLLLPVGTKDEVALVLDEVWPGVNLDTLEQHPIPARSRLFRWINAHTYYWGYNEDVLMSGGGLIWRHTTLVPHARIQSVGIVQGPVQRLVDLASVAAHTTAGPVNMNINYLENASARHLAMTELDRMRAARARGIVRNQRIGYSTTSTWAPPAVPVAPGPAEYGQPPLAPGQPQTPDQWSAQGSWTPAGQHEPGYGNAPQAYQPHYPTPPQQPGDGLGSHDPSHPYSADQDQTPPESWLRPGSTEPQ